MLWFTQYFAVCIDIVCRRGVIAATRAGVHAVRDWPWRLCTRCWWILAGGCILIMRGGQLWRVVGLVMGLRHWAVVEKREREVSEWVRERESKSVATSIAENLLFHSPHQQSGSILHKQFYLFSTLMASLIISTSINIPIINNILPTLL